MKLPNWLLTTLSLIVFLFTLSFVFMKHSTAVYTHPLTIGTKNIWVAYAQTPAEQAQGLSGTIPLTDEQGMLFIFPQENMPAFWMKDMNYPLDIIWIGADKKVKDITANLAPETYPATFSPKDPVQYVLEVSSRFAEKNNITIGTAVSF